MTERITLDLSGSEDATQKGGDFPALPTAWYKASIYSAEVRNVKKEGPNKGKPFYNLRLHVIDDEGNYDRRVVFDGYVQLFTVEDQPWGTDKIEQLSRVVGVWDGEDRKNAVIPTKEELEGIEVEARVKKERDKYAEKKYEEENGKPSPEPLFTNSVTGYRPVGGWPSAEDIASGKTSTGGKKKQKIAL